MADPLSIAGLATGLVSLGIQVCGGITAYLDAIKCRADDVASVSRKVGDFENVLRITRTALGRVDSSHQVSTTAAEACLQSCETELKALESFLSELTGSGTSPVHFKDKIKEKARKLAYAFDRPKLEQLESRLDRANGVFQTALQVIGLDISSSATRVLGTIESSSRTISSELLSVKSEVAALGTPLVKINDTLPSIQHSVDSLPPLIALRTDHLSTQVRDGTQSLRVDLQQLQSSFHASWESDRVQLSRIEQSLLNSEQSGRLANIERLLGELFSHGASTSAREQHMDPDVLVGRLVSKPSSLGALCDEVAGLPGQGESRMKGPPTPSKPLPSYSPVKNSSMTCICRRRKRWQRHQLRLGNIELYDETSFSEVHLPGCRFSRIAVTRRHRSFGFKFIGLAGLLNRAVGVAFSMSSGAGGFGIGPSFTYYATVDKKTAPAFRLLSILDDCIEDLCENYQLVHINAFIESVSRKILKLFDERRASPTDVDDSNRSLLHYANFVISRLAIYKVSVFAGVDLYKSLSRCGIPASYDNAGHSSFSTALISLPSEQALVAEALIPESHDNLIFAFNTTTISFYPEFDILRLLEASQRIAEAYDCGPLSLAVLANDLDRVKQILTYHPTTIKEKDLYNQTPLHLAVDKPECLQLLIQSVNNKVLDGLDYRGMAPVDYALSFSREICTTQDSVLCDAQCPCTRGLEMLLNANCALYKPNGYRGYPGCRLVASRRGMLKYANAMKSRREELRLLALERLSPLEAEELNLEGGNVLDARACHVIERLRECNVVVADALLVQRPRGFSEQVAHRSVYHFLRDSSHADYFFDLGFRDLDTTNAYGLASLIIYRYNDSPLYFMWLIEHGAQLFHHLEYTPLTRPYEAIMGATCAHWVFTSIGNGLRSPFEDGAIVENKDVISQFNVRVMPADVMDKCCCKCTLHGCSPFIWLLKSMFTFNEEDALGLARAIGYYTNHFGSDMEVKHHRDAIRFATFEALDIQHTCCDAIGKNRAPNYDPEDIREIEEEQAALLETLEDLVKEFEEKAIGILEQEGADSSTLMAEFWTGYWYDRVSKVLADLDGCDISDDEKAAAERIGVRWDDESSETSEEFENRHDIKYWYRRIDEIA